MSNPINFNGKKKESISDSLHVQIDLRVNHAITLAVRRQVILRKVKYISRVLYQQPKQKPKVREGNYEMRGKHTIRLTMREIF